MTGMEALLYLTLNVYREATTESYVGKMAVAHVTLNRAERCGENIKETVLKNGQFSWTLGQHSAILNHLKPWQVKSFSRCMLASERAMRSYDFTEGATYYHAEYVHPKWAKDKKFIMKIGKHLFYSGTVDSCKKRKTKIIVIAPENKKKKVTVKDQARLAVQALKDKLHKEKAK